MTGSGGRTAAVLALAVCLGAVAVALLCYRRYRRESAAALAAARRRRPRLRAADRRRPAAPAAPPAAAQPPGFVAASMRNWKTMRNMIRLQNEMSELDRLLERVTASPEDGTAPPR